MPRSSSHLRGGLGGVAIAVIIGLVISPFAPHQPWHATFLTYVVAIVLQAVPFLLLGAVIGAAIESFIPTRWLPTMARRLGPWGLPAMVVVAPIFPICECAVLGVGRGLLRRGLPLPHVLTYLIAAPILNPTVLASTWIAFGDPLPAFLRGLGGGMVALLIGWWVSTLAPTWCLRPRPLLAGFTAAPQEAIPLMVVPGSIAAPGYGAAVKLDSDWRKKGLRWCTTSLEHFLELASWFLIGVALAATLKTMIGTRLLEDLGGGVVSGPATMMVTAIVLSLCAEADAFVAASFTGFSLPALLAFLVLGPMLDLKLLLMYRSIFTVRFISALAAAMLVLVSAYIAGLTLLL